MQLDTHNKLVWQINLPCAPREKDGFQDFHWQMKVQQVGDVDKNGTFSPANRLEDAYYKQGRLHIIYKYVYMYVEIKVKIIKIFLTRNSKNLNVV